MGKYFVCFLIVALSACSTKLSKEEYDKLATQNEELKIENELLNEELSKEKQSNKVINELYANATLYDEVYSYQNNGFKTYVSRHYGVKFIIQSPLESEISICENKVMGFGLCFNNNGIITPIRLYTSVILSAFPESKVLKSYDTGLGVMEVNEIIYDSNIPNDVVDNRIRPFLNDVKIKFVD